jgi:hypothetical protein
MTHQSSEFEKPRDESRAGWGEDRGLGEMGSSRAEREVWGGRLSI